MVDTKSKVKKYYKGSVTGLVLSVGIGFALYFALNSINIASNWLDYNAIVANAGNNPIYKLIWYVMNFTEAQFYAGFFASLGIIIGGFIAWRLDVKNSRFRGFDVSYGSNLWPWVLASQLLSLFIAIFVLNYTRLFNTGEYTWLPTFITVVGAPPAIMLLYGPNIKALLTSSILGGTMGFPVAMWISNHIIPVLDVPGVVSNVFTMAITGLLICAICKALPWMEKMPSKPLNREGKSQEEVLKEMESPQWFVRRVLADFSEAQFYGNEIAGILGGIIGPPLAEYVCDKLPEGYHPTIGNVTSMGLTTIVVSVIIKVLPWF